MAIGPNCNGFHAAINDGDGQGATVFHAKVFSKGMPPVCCRTPMMRLDNGTPLEAAQGLAACPEDTPMDRRRFLTAGAERGSALVAGAFLTAMASWAQTPPNPRKEFAMPNAQRGAGRKAGVFITGSADAEIGRPAHLDGSAQKFVAWRANGAMNASRLAAGAREP
mgnify:CR=1 FL=1